jgi:hypothetical protein
MIAMRRFAVVLSLILLSAARLANPQVVESATARQFSVTAGGFGSVFNPADSNIPFYEAGSSAASIRTARF